MTGIAHIDRSARLSRRPVLRILVAGLLTGIAIYATTFLHELGHFVAGRLLGYDAYFNSISSVGYDEKVSAVDRAVFNGAGPAVSIALGLIGLVICIRFRSSDSIGLTAIRGATAITLAHLGVLLFTTPPTAEGTDIAAVVAYLDAPLAVRMVLVVVGLVLVVVAALVYGRYVLRVDSPVSVRIGRGRVVTAIVLAAAQVSLLVAHLVSMTRTGEPTALPSIDLLALFVLMPIIGALFVPWRQEGIRALVRRDAVPIWIGYGLQLVLSIIVGSTYAVGLLSIFGTVMIGMAVAARARRSSSPAVEAAR